MNAPVALFVAAHHDGLIDVTALAAALAVRPVELRRVFREAGVSADSSIAGRCYYRASRIRELDKLFARDRHPRPGRCVDEATVIEGSL